MSPSCAPSTITRSHSSPFTRWTVESVTCPARAGRRRRRRPAGARAATISNVAGSGCTAAIASSAVTSSRCDASRPRPELSSVPIAAPSPTSSRTERSTAAASLDATSCAEPFEVVGEHRAADRCRPMPSASAWAAQRRERPAPAVADRVDDLGGDPPVRAARDLGEIAAAELAAVGDRSTRAADTRARCAHRCGAGSSRRPRP